jgi:hypothetical protein
VNVGTPRSVAFRTLQPPFRALHGESASLDSNLVALSFASWALASSSATSSRNTSSVEFTPPHSSRAASLIGNGPPPLPVTRLRRRTALDCRRLFSSEGRTEQERRMTSQRSTDRPRTSTDPDRRPAWGMRETDPPPRSTESGLRAAWGIGAFVVVMLIVAAIGLWWSHQSPTSSTATGPSNTQSAPSTTGQGGAPNTGAAR